MTSRTLLFVQAKLPKQPFRATVLRGIPLLENKKVWGFPDLKIEKYEIHIHAFVHSINGKFIMFDPHLHKIIFEICTAFSQK